MGNENTLLVKINGTAKNFLDELDKVKKATKETEKILKATAKASGAAFLGLAATIASLTKAYADYETALVGVGKTTNITGKALKNFGKDVQALSKRVPIATNDLLGIAQAAGQLGVEGEENLLKFTETIAKLGVASDLAGEEAATALTRILTVTNEGVGEIDKFASVIVALGNNFAATESEITHMTTEVSRSIAVFNASAAESAALGTALKAIGVQAQLGGSAVGRSFRAIDKTIRTGGQGLKNLEQLTGMTGEQLKQTFETDAVSVFQSFLSGLKDISDQGGDTTAALAQFELKGDEILKVLPTLAKNSDLVARALKTAATETKNATALNEEAAKAFSTLNSRVAILRNNFQVLSTDLGERFAEDASGLVDTVTDLVKSLNDLDDTSKDNIATGLKFAAVATGIVASLALTGLAVLKAIAAWEGLLLAIGAIKTIAIAVGAALSSSILAPLLAIGAAIGGVIFGYKKLIEAVVEAGKLPDNLKKVNEEIEKQQALVKRLTDLQKELGKEQDEESNRFLNIQKKKLEALEAQKKKLEEIQRTQPDFGTGELLVRPKAAAGPLDFKLPGEVSGPEVQAPLAADPAAREREVAAEVKAVEDAEKKKADIRSGAALERIAQKQAEQDAIRDLIFLDAAAQVNNLSEREQELLAKEAEFAAQRRDLKVQELAARNIEDAQERDLALQNVQLRNQLLAQQEAEFADQRAQVKAEEREREKALEEELRQLDLEERQALTEQDLELLRQQLMTEDEADRQYARMKAQRHLKERQQEQQDVRQHGQAIATLNKFFNSQEVQGVRSVTSDLAQLRQSSSKKMRRIGKAAARVNAALATAQGAINAYASLAVIPIVGPALGAAAAAALILFGIEQQRKIDAVQAQGGGRIPSPTGVSGGLRDRVPALLEPGEVVVPNRLAPDFIQTFGRPEEPGTAGDVPEMRLLLGFADNAIEVLEAQRQEKVALGIIDDRNNF